MKTKRRIATMRAGSLRSRSLRSLRSSVARADRRRRARTSRRWRRRGSRDGSQDRTARSWPATTSSASCRRSARSRCRARGTSCCRSSSPPGRGTAARDQRRRVSTARRGTVRRGGHAGRARCRSPTTATSKAPSFLPATASSCPTSQGFGYDSYATLDVKDKIVVVLRYFPEDAEPKTKGILARYADLRYKAMAARQHGAKAMVVVTGPRFAERRRTGADDVRHRDRRVGHRRGQRDRRRRREDLPAGQAAGRGAEGARRRQPARDRVRPAGRHRARARRRSCARSAPATTSSATCRRPTPVTTIAKPWVAIGAHYDHLGHGEAGNTLAGKDDAGKIHFGADDNASGSAAVLAIAATLAKQPRKRNVLVAFWSGEELGLIGSSAFSTKPPVPLDAIAAYLNFDMVGRMQDNKLTVQATGSSPAWAKIIEQANVAAGFDLAVQEDPYQPTDVATFNAAGMPSLSFFTGTHADYHKPSDTADKIDYEDLDRVVDFAAAIVRRLEDAADAPAFTKVDQQMQQGAGRAGVRLFTGTIPDYSTEVKGLLLERRRRRRTGRTGRLTERRRHRRDRRPDDHEHLRLHVRARRAEDRPASESRSICATARRLETTLTPGARK